MRTSGAASSRRQEEDVGSPMRNRQEASSQDTTPIQYTDHQQQQQAELFRKLESLKGHVLRGQDSPRGSHQQQPHMGFHGGPPPPPPYYNPYPPYGMYHPTPSNPPPHHGFPPHQSMYPAGHYPHHMMPRPPYPQGQYVDIGPDILDPQLQHDPRFFPSRYADSHHVEKTKPFSPHAGAQGHHHTRWPSEVNSDIGGGAFAREYFQAAADSRRCHPLAGGAPFVACHNCFELLYLPRKKLLSPQEKKMQCGACSEVFSFTIVHNKLLFSSSSASALEETKNRVSVEVGDRSAVVADCPFKEPITKAVSPSEHSDDDNDEGGRSSISSETQKDVVKSVRRRAKDAKVPPPPPPENSNLLELFEYSNVNRAALAYGMSQLGYDKQQVSYTKQDSLKPESVACETDISDNGYYNNSTEVSDNNSRISNVSKEEESTRRRNRKDSFSETTDYQTVSNDDRELEVWVNGHLIPEDQVINAEKQAGPVQAGNYWYDYRAGFWGVMGNPCLGIIPPFIEEFSRPMPDNCGAGNTGVFVNGRELHERDLELLVSRGLPRGKNRSYIVDISGRVLDGDSGEELKCLGKLAPTIEKVKHGFGMRVPRYLASST